MRLAQSLKLAPKEKQVLEHFIIKESEGIGEDSLYPWGNTYETANTCQNSQREILPYYRPHPARLSKDLEISRKHAKDVCEKFAEKIKIFSFKNEDTQNRAEKTRHYHLKDDFSTFKILVKIIIENYDHKKRVELLNYSFLSRNIDCDLVKRILAEKKVIISRQVDIINWKGSEAELFFNEVYRNPPPPINFFPCKSFEEYAKGVATTDDIGGVPCRAGAVEYLHLRFPVQLKNTNIDALIEAVNQLHVFSLDRLPDLKKNASAIEDYYSIDEYEQIILPFLGLILISPTVLNEFINSDWDPGYESRSHAYDVEGLGELKFPFLFELIVTALADVVKTRSIPEGGELSEVWVNTKQSNVRNEGSLLEIRFKTGYIVRFNVRFNTSHYPENEYPKRFHYKIDVKTGIEPYGAITNFTNIKSVTNIRDPVTLMKELREEKNPISHYLRSKFSHKFNNILEYIDLNGKIPTYQINLLLIELNRIITKNDLSKENVFQDLLELEDPFCQLRTIPLVPNQLRWIEFDEITWRNFILIVKAFPAAFNTITKEEFEKNLEKMNPH